MRRFVVLVLAVTLLGCGGGDDEGADHDAPCGEDHQERVDPASLNHVFAGGTEPEYATDPPTSGPHAPGAALSGILGEPLSRPEQVGQLEAGAVLLQYLPDLAADARATLEGLAGDRVLVLPNPDLPAPVVATAWTRKLECRTVDAEALRAFAQAHVGQGPGTDG